MKNFNEVKLLQKPWNNLRWQDVFKEERVVGRNQCYAGIKTTKDYK